MNDDTRTQAGNSGLFCQAWIFDHDRRIFLEYVADRPADELSTHTEQGQTIVHRSRADARDGLGDDVVIESGVVRPWPAGDVLEIAGLTYRHNDL